MKTRQDLLDFVAGLSPRDTSLAVGLAALLHRADPTGRVTRPVWVSAVREAYALASEATGGRARVDEGSAPLGEGSATAGPPDAYLTEQLVARLEATGVAARDVRSASWERLAVDPELWAAISDHRGAILEEIDREVHRLRGGAHGMAARETTLVEGGSTLRAEGLIKAFKRRRVVDQVDLTVRQGEIVGLLGPNGAGKTTTFYMIVGLIPPDGGQVQLDERVITEVPMFKRARLGIGYLAQEPSVFRKLTVEENILAILETLPLKKAQRKERLEELLDELSIAHLRDNKAYSLSGGERRRLEITRALVQNPKFMLLDEPFAGIDPIAVNDIQQIVAELKTRGIGVVISDHNVEQTLDIVDRAYIMYEGRIRVSGTVSELVWNDEVAEIYLGPSLTHRMRQRYPPPPVAESVAPAQGSPTGGPSG